MDGILAKRRAQAEVIGPIYRALVAELGKETAQRLIGDAIRQAAIAEGQQLAAQEATPPGLRDFAKILPMWTKDDALTLEFQAESETNLDFNVVRCRYAEMYHEMGLAEIGHLLSCARDGAFCEGYAPNLTLTRTQTIMQGATHCDFRYRTNPDAS